MSQEEVETETPSEYVACPACQQPVKSKGRYGHFKTAHPELNYQEYKDKFKPAPVPEGREPTREAPLYKGELDTTTILRDILKKHPDIPSKVVEEVCSWAEYGPIHPTQLVYLLSSMRGISTTTANIVAQKYSLALQRAATEGKMQLPSALYAPTPQPQPTPFGYPMPLYQQGFAPQFSVQAPEARPQAPIPSQQMYPAQQPLWPQQPWYLPQPQPTQAPLTEDRIRSVIREEMEVKERGKGKEPEPYVDIEDPARDHEGNVILGADDRPIMKRLRVPVSQAGLFAPKEDLEAKILQKMELYKKIFGEKGLDESKIREVIRQEMPKGPEKPLTPEVKPEDVQRAAAEAASGAVQEFIKVHEKEDKEERRHRELLSAIQAGASAKAVEGYKEDSYRILGQGLSEVASATKDRKPIEVIVREGAPLLLGAPPPKQVEKGAEEGLVEKFQKRGWIAEG